MSHMSHIGQLVYVLISYFCVSIYPSYEPLAIRNVNRNSGIHTFYIFDISPWRNMHATLCICSTVLLLWSTYRPHSTPCISKIKQKNCNSLFTILVPHICWQQIFPWNAIYANLFLCRYQTTMAVYIPHMNSLHSTLPPQALVYTQFKLLLCAPEHICLQHQTCMSHCH